MYCQSVSDILWKLKKKGEEVLIGVAIALFTIIINLSCYSVLLQHRRAQRMLVLKTHQVYWRIHTQK